MDSLPSRDDLVNMAIDWVDTMDVRVFPVRPNKVPYGKTRFSGKPWPVPNQKKDATKDPGIIRAWAKQHPDCQWAMLLPPEVIAIDTDALGDGSPNLWASQPSVKEELEERSLLQVETPSKGTHHYFQQLEPGRWRGDNSKSAIGAPVGVDVRSGSDFYIIMPGCTAVSKLDKKSYQYRVTVGKMVGAEDLLTPGPILQSMLDRFYRSGRPKTDEAQPSDWLAGDIITPRDVKQILRHIDGHYLDYANTDPKVWERALQLFVQKTGAQPQPPEPDGTIKFTRPGSKNGHSAKWNSPSQRHGAKPGRDGNYAKVPLGYPKMLLLSPAWSELFPGLTKNKAHSATDLIKILLSGDPDAQRKEEGNWERNYHSSKHYEDELAATEGMTDVEFADFYGFTLHPDGRLTSQQEDEDEASRIEAEIATAEEEDDDEASRLEAEIATYEEDDLPPEIDDDSGPPPDMDMDDDSEQARMDSCEPVPEPQPEKNPQKNESQGESEPATPSDDPPGGHDDFPWDDSWFRPGGPMALFRNELALREINVQPAFGVSGALAFMSAAILRKVRTPCGLLSNLYFVNTAPSGEGKDACRKLLETVLNNNSFIRDGHSIVEAIPHSSSSMGFRLAERPDRMIITDEIGKLFEAGNSNSQNGNHATLVGELLKLFTHGVGTYRPRQTVNPDTSPQSCHTPCVGIIGFSVPGTLFDSMGGAAVRSGWWPRFLWFPGLDEPLDNPLFCSNRDIGELAPGLVRAAAMWGNWTPESTSMIPAIGENIGAPVLAVWKFTPEALDLLDAGNKAWKTRKRSHYREGLELESTMLTRRIEVAKKLALLFAADRLEKPSMRHEITGADADKAIKLANWSQEKLLEICDGLAAESNDGRGESKLRNWFEGQYKANPKNWFTGEEIRVANRVSYLGSAAVRSRILTYMAAEGTIARREITIAGVQRNQYQWGG